ncbi:hypothetical protein SAMN04489765_1485 [Tsukamurella pulmonis]|uniref:Uncharacterized protein n=1 Tax=Tsukamurella pulmonis TaxID=47312 RepID=A0A1H1D2T6_9ACTN|nr:hypothetical protein [Tsukamurella pulmonis]SDQ70116.1 hypothetical protein SAMN04489765_1485 [Tsukamurella pulmonis]SUP22670.1 Uncharacterised protein [Tsukamurella pulmonis]
MGARGLSGITERRPGGPSPEAPRPRVRQWNRHARRWDWVRQDPAATPFGPGARRAV